MNAYIDQKLTSQNWSSKSNNRIVADYNEADCFLGGYQHRKIVAYREMDFIKNRVGLEIQMGKYAFMVYNISAKMTIFRKSGKIDMGVEVVVLQDMAKQMSTGVSFFEQCVWDLKTRGVADIDTPVIVFGIIHHTCIDVNIQNIRMAENNNNDDDDNEDDE